MTTENDFEQLFVDGNWRCCWREAVVTECVFEKKADTDALGHRNWTTNFEIHFRNNTGAYQISGGLRDPVMDAMESGRATVINLLMRAAQELQRIDLLGKKEDSQ